MHNIPDFLTVKPRKLSPDSALLNKTVLPFMKVTSNRDEFTFVNTGFAIRHISRKFFRDYALIGATAILTAFGSDKLANISKFYNATDLPHCRGEITTTVWFFGFC